MDSIGFLFSRHSPVTVLGAWLVAVYCWWGVLAMGGQVSQASEHKALLWQGLRAVFLGFGTWAFHFIGMLGWQPGVMLSFGARQTLLSLLVSMLAAWPLLGAMRRGVTAGDAWPGVLAYCTGLSLMHYMGIYAADTVPGIRWAPGWIALSSLLALVLAICTLDMKRWINGAAPSERLGRRSLTALLLGSLLFAVHFTSVAGATYSAGTICVTPGSLGGEQLAILVAFATTIIFSSTMWFSVSDARLETQLQQQALALQTRSDILEQSLRKDGETDLPNRLALEQALQRAAGREAVVLTIFCIELEGYQVIADSWGQETATALTKELAQRLRGELEAARILARTGDAQFIAVMTGDMPPTTLAQMASSIVAALRRPFGSEGLAVSLGCRIGVSAGSPAEGQYALLAQARSAAAFAMRAGQPWSVYKEHMQNDVRAELELQGELRLALERQQFALAYQPKVDAHSGTIVALEALLRWQHPRLGWVSPARFIPVAERYGLMGEIGNWVLQEAIAQLARWRAMGLALRMSINVSPQQLESDDLVSRVYTLLNAHQLEARQVCLEVTESTAMLRPSHTRALLGQLRALGVELSIDDFGTGHSGLSYLYRLPVTELKIDRSFVIALDEGSLPVIEATVKMAKAYGLRVVAEGVELPQQQQALLACGCDEFQGYLFGRPVPASEIETILLATQAAA